MSCRDCEEKSIHGAYYRWKNANIEIVGCRKHVVEIMEVLNVVQFQRAVPIVHVNPNCLDAECCGPRGETGKVVK